MTDRLFQHLSQIVGWLKCHVGMVIQEPGSLLGCPAKRKLSGVHQAGWPGWLLLSCLSHKPKHAWPMHDPSR